MMKRILTGALVLISGALAGCVILGGGVPAAGLGMYWTAVCVYWAVNLWSQRK